MALAQLDFIARTEVVPFLGPPGPSRLGKTGKCRLTTALGIAAMKVGRSVHRCTLVEALGRAEREGRLVEVLPPAAVC
jgi:hypothetical protein